MEETTVTSKWHDTPQAAHQEIVDNFGENEDVTVGFNCRNSEDKEFNCVISNYDDLTEKADRWSKQKNGVAVDYIEVEIYYEEHPEAIPA